MDHFVVTGKCSFVVHWFSESSGRGYNIRRLDLKSGLLCVNQKSAEIWLMVGVMSKLL